MTPTSDATHKPLDRDDSQIAYRDIARVLEREARSLRLGAHLSSGNPQRTADALNEAACYMRELAGV